ncbi:sensor histidine kinase [Chelativorans sp. J32]|uniref:sensor histidine kinase n=1 Tax=Chelativorans sp. J32 TaxID=935840 RepID=UPI0004B3C1E9|nr:HAMP domain-containing sensor histidine kinase [Chelativorans sp. J32]
MSVSLHARKNKGRLPLTTSLPLFVALAMFVVAVGSTQIGVRFLRASNEAALQDQAVVFLDAVAGGIAAELAARPETVRQQIAAALTYRTALREESIAVRWRDAAGELHTVVIGEAHRPILRSALDAWNTPGPEGRRVWQYPDRQLTVVMRSYREAEIPFALSAAFDASEVIEAGDVAAIAALIVDILVAVLAAVAVYVVTRRALAPLDAFIARLAMHDEPDTMHAGLRRGDELRRLEAALALREKSEAERAQVLSDVAEQERDALLARMAAGIAHEVRNPLAGLMNGVSTLKRFGDEPRVREETVKLLEQGLESIGRVVDVTLATYRRRSERRILAGRDIQDLDLLIRPEAKHVGVDIVWELDDQIEIPADADALRQILINLLLNAVRASPPGGRVLTRVELGAGKDTVRISICDEGEGMPADMVASLVSGKVDDVPLERSLGIWVVANLVEQIGARLSIHSEQGKGTTVTLVLPNGAEASTEEGRGS